jgi:hypothetical protein
MRLRGPCEERCYDDDKGTEISRMRESFESGVMVRMS